MKNQKLLILALVFSSVESFAANEISSIEVVKCVVQAFPKDLGTEIVLPSTVVPCSIELLQSISYVSQSLSECTRVKVSETKSVNISIAIDGTPNRMMTSEPEKVLQGMSHFPQKYRLTVTGFEPNNGFLSAAGAWQPSKLSENINLGSLVKKPVESIRVNFSDLEFIYNDLAITCGRYVIPSQL